MLELSANFLSFILLIGMTPNNALVMKMSSALNNISNDIFSSLIVNSLRFSSFKIRDGSYPLNTHPVFYSYF